MSSGHAPRALNVLRHTEESLRAGGPYGPPDPLTFYIRMPFNLGTVDGTGFTLRRSDADDEPPWVELAVARVHVSLADAALRPYERGLDRLLGGPLHDLEAGDSVQTWVVSTTLNTVFSGELAPASYEELVTLMFDRCLEAINRLVRAEMLAGGIGNAAVLAKESLDQEVAYSTMSALGRAASLARLRLHSRNLNPVPVIKDEANYVRAVREAIGSRLAADAAAAPHPLVLARELERLAAAQLGLGGYTSALITLQTASESFLRGIHRLLLVDRGLESADLAVADDVPFATLVKTALPALLAGDWSSRFSKPKAYLENVYEVRNRITHSGVEPSWREVEPAFLAHRELVALVEHQVVIGWRKRPRTLLALTERWAGGQAVSPKAARPTLEALAAEVPAYWLPADLAGRQT